MTEPGPNPDANPLIRYAKTEGAMPLPPFDAVNACDVLPAVRWLIDEGRAMLDRIARLSPDEVDWARVMQPLSDCDERLSRVWGMVGHLCAVRDAGDWREVHARGVREIAAWEAELAQHPALFRALRTLAAGEEWSRLPAARQAAVRHLLRDFRLAGAELSGDKQRRFREIRMRLAELATRFEQNVLDATRAWRLHLHDATRLQGLPDSVIREARARAAARGLDGWLFTLDAPSYLPFMQHAEDRELRRRMYRAYVTRASRGRRDNGPLIREILRLRQEAARLLGFESFAEYSLATKMAETPREVTDFLRELAARSRPHAERELAELRTFAAERLGIRRLMAWDIPFASERLKEARYAFSQEEIKPYLSEHRVLEGLFGLAGRLFGIAIEPGEAPVWHPDARFYRLIERGEVRAGFYLDAYAREGKRAGAWMDECLLRRRRNQTLQLPVAHIVCNFAAPAGRRPALWTHEDLTTLFHEFGHALHHMLTDVDEPLVGGIRGVPWDAVELPSQFMENFCWQREVMRELGRHVDTGGRMPERLFERLRGARNFQSGMMMLRQIEFALFDMELHGRFDPGREDVHELLERVRDEVAVVRPPAYNRFENSFSHIFAGGYAAGYYAYKWAEVLSADAFAAFEEEGVFNPETARRFRNTILAVGGSRDMMESFVAFRGRRPSLDALLRHSGLN